MSEAKPYGLAGVLGWLSGGFLASSLQLGIGRTLGPQDPTWSVTNLVICLVVIAVLLTLATLVPAVAAARRPVTDVLRDVPPERVSWFNRRAGQVPSRLSLLGAQEAASQPARGGLAALAIAVAVVGTIVSIGFVQALDTVTGAAAMAGDPWDIAVVGEDLDRDRTAATIDATPGVERWFSDVERRSTFRDGAFLSVATGGDPAAAAYRVVDGRGLQHAGDAIVGYGFMRRFDVAVGDRIEFLTGTTPIAVTIVGWYRDTEDSGEILRYRFEDLAAAEPGVRPSVYRITVAGGADLASVASALGERLGPAVRTELLDTGQIRLNDINFATASADILPQFRHTLDVVGEVLARWPQLKIEIGGHTDARGGDAANLALSRRRVNSVRAYLLEHFPKLAAAQLVAVGYGESQPLVPNTSPSNMDQNRRVEFKVLNREVLQQIKR